MYFGFILLSVLLYIYTTQNSLFYYNLYHRGVGSYDCNFAE